MPAFLLDGGDRQGGFSLENAAEEMLNGIFCHYEPPTSEKAQREAAEQARSNPSKYTSRKKNKSILRPSKLYRKKHTRSVTWRDEANKKDNLEGKVATCAADSCDIFGNSTNTDGLVDALAPNEKAPYRPRKLQEDKKTPKATAPLKKHDGPPKKVLYDDEGNPIHEDGTIPEEENEPKSRWGNDDSDVYEPDNYDRPPTSQALPYRRIRSPPVRSGTPRYARDEDLDETEAEFLERVGRTPRGRSPTPLRSRYDDEEEEPIDNGGTRKKSPRGMGWMKRFRRPSTPHKTREGEDDVNYDSDGSFVDRIGKSFRRRSSSRERGRSQSPRNMENSRENDGYDYPPRGRQFSRSPSRVSRGDEDYDESYRGSRSPARRSDVYSDLTDDYFDEPRDGRYMSRGARSQSFMEDGIEVDYYEGRGRSKSPSRYENSRGYYDGRRKSREFEEGDYTRRSPRDLDEGRGRRSSRGYDDELSQRSTRDYEEGRGRSRDYGSDERSTSRDYDMDYGNENRRMSNDRRLSQDMSGKGGRRDETASPSPSPRSMRRWKFGSKKSKEDESGDDGASRDAPRPSKFNREIYRDEDDEHFYGEGSDERQNGRSRRVSEPIKNRPRRTVDTNSVGEDSYEKQRPHSTTAEMSRRGPIAIDTSYDEDPIMASRNRDPTPRMSRDADDRYDDADHQAPLPPTPRRKERFDEDREDDSSDRRRSGRKAERTERSSERRSETGRRPKPVTVDTDEEDFETRRDRTHRALMRQLSPTSMATDDEIREEVSSVGMESNTLRPLQYPNPFLEVPPPVLEEDHDVEDEEDLSELDPSTISSREGSKTSAKSYENEKQVRRQQRQSYSGRRSNKSKSDNLPEIEATNSGSTKSKKYWRGWRKTIGKVKNIVKDIDEKRLPPPVMPRVEQSSSMKRRSKAKE